jgi:hypothetical protein
MITAKSWIKLMACMARGSLRVLALFPLPPTHMKMRKVRKEKSALIVRNALTWAFEG